jgi:hypothetical protein
MRVNEILKDGLIRLVLEVICRRGDKTELESKIMGTNGCQFEMKRTAENSAELVWLY